MTAKRIIGLVIAIVGVLLIILSIYINSRVSSELGSVHRKTEMMSNNPLTKAGGRNAKKATGTAGGMVNQTAADKAAPYSTKAMWSLISGIVLIVIGGAVVIFPRNKS